MRSLVIGDVHAVEGELDDCQALIDGILPIVVDEEVDTVIFLGDQYHNHKLVNCEVMAWWRQAFAALHTTPVIALVGNHDLAAAGSSPNHSMLAHVDAITVVDKPTELDGVLFMPYTHDNESFLRSVRGSSAKCVVAHQAVQGSRYDNGFYAPDAASLEDVQDKSFVVGHMHTPYRFDQVSDGLAVFGCDVFYPGAPRWRTASDANIERSVNVIEFGAKGAKVIKSVETKQFCNKILRFEDRIENPLQLEINPKWRYIVDIHGDAKFIQERRAKWSGCRVRTFPVNTAKSAVRESMGIGAAIKTFVGGYQAKHGTSTEVLEKMVQDRLGGLL